MWLTPRPPHTVENVDDSEIRLLNVELKHSNLTGLEHDAWIERNAVSAEDANPDHRRGRREPDAIHPDFREFTAANRVSIQETA